MYCDFSIPDYCRGKTLKFSTTWDSHVLLPIPQNACYLDVKTFEDEEEFLGCQDQSDRQEISFYDSEEKHVSSLNLEAQIITWKLMSQLEQILIKNY